MTTNKLHRCLSCGLLLAASLLAPLASAQASGPPSERPAEAARVHLVLLGHTPRGAFGDACRNDIVALEKTLRAGFGDMSERLIVHDLSLPNPDSGIEYNGADVLNYLGSMAVNDNEIVIVYHSGHGQIRDRTRPEESHELALNRGSVGRGDMLRILRGRSPRGVIVLTDCCSAFAGRGVDAEGRCGDDVLNAETVRNLFLRMSGVVSITAAQDGTCGLIGYAGHNPAGAGSSFTVALLRLAYQEGKTYTTWAEFFPDLQEETWSASGHMGPRNRHRPRAFQMN